MTAEIVGTPADVASKDLTVASGKGVAADTNDDLAKNTTEGSPSSTMAEDSPVRSPSAGEGGDSTCTEDVGSPTAEGKPKTPAKEAIAEEDAEEDCVPKDSEAPSRGSILHEEGSCSPCVWFWKPQGCQRGQECGYCHLCPEGEIKSRKKAKLATIRATASEKDGKEDTGEEPDSPSAESMQQRQSMTSMASERIATPGSTLHESGECRPCAWFYKTQGCLNGADCRHCHLCPEGEIKARKKSKVDMIRTASQQSDASTSLMAEAQSGQETGEIPPPPGLAAPKLGRAPSASEGSALHGTGECRPCAWYHKAQGCQNGVECRHCHMCPEGEIKLRRKIRSATMTSTASNAPIEDIDEEDEDDDDEESSGSEDEREPAKIMLPLAARNRKSGSLPSPGSDLHGTGQCRPCAWFHKPGGCENGAECRHCHLCPEGEIRNRRKNKVAAMKKAASQEQEMGMEQAMWMVQKQQEALIAASWQAQAHWEATATAIAAARAEEAAAFALSPMALDPHAAAAAAAMSSAAAIAATAAMMSAASPMGPHMAAVAGFGMPSAGSALHALGKCRPCAWFWKPQGCQNGQACAHCHLCPQGELKARKRMKEVAMRMGASSPTASPMASSPSNGSKTGRSTRSEPRVVKIASCLGD